MPDAAVVVEGLHKAYGPVVAVSDLSIEVRSGEIFGLLGPNGSGKTTTVECAQGLRTADDGRIRVLGLDPLTQRGELRRRVGTQLQESSLPDRIKVWEALRLFASLSPGATDWSTLIDQWGLAAKRNATFASLSGGQRQRLLVALALVNRPEVVFLDEMTTGLDPAARREAWDLVASIRDSGATVVLVTHFMDEAERLCDRVAVVKQGRVVAVDTPQGLVAAHADGIRLSFGAAGHDLGWLAAVADVQRVDRRGDRVVVSGRGAVIARVGHALVEHGLAPADLRVEQSSLEDVYLRLTAGAGEGGADDADTGRGDLGRAEAVRP
jgi:ABC-2 type transport system ATP-binding protein